MALKRLLSWFGPPAPARRQAGRRRPVLRPVLEMFEDRTVPAVNILNNAGSGYAALSFNESGGYVPPDASGAAGPSAYVETVNQAVALYTAKATGAGAVTDSLSHFLFTTGGLTRADSGSGLSDPVVAYDEKIQRFVVGDQDVNFNTHVSAFDLAVSRSSNPTTLSAADWIFYKISTTQAGEDADYPGNFGYNADAFVFTLNMFAVNGTAGTNHTQVVSVSAADLAAAAAAPRAYANNLADFSVRPTAMHDAAAGDPMWLVTDHGDGLSIDVYKMTGGLSTAAAFTRTNLAVTAYSQAVAPKNPNGTSITTNIDSRIMKAAEANNTIVAAHTVAASPTQDVAQWYAVDVSTGTPRLAQQGRVGAGANTYVTYPGIDINPAGAIGMSVIKSGTDTAADYMSMLVTGRAASDPAGTMQTPVAVPYGSGLANYTDFASTHRAGDLSGINVDPIDGSFWAVNEFANTQATANWGTAVANFLPSQPASAADVAVSLTGPTSVTAGTDATYTITFTNNGPNPAAGVVLTDTLPAGSTFVSLTQTAGSDAFTLSQSGGTATASASASIAAGGTDTFTLVVSAPSSLAPGAPFSDSVSVSTTSSDTNSANNSATVTGSIVGPSADLAVANTGPATASEGGQLVYTVTVTNTDSTNSGTGVVLTETLGANLNFVSATASQGTFTRSGSAVTFTVGTLAPGATVTVTVTATATESGTLTNSASVSASSADPNTANNSGTASTSVAVAPIVVSTPITVTSKNVSNVAVATFTHANGIEPASAFTATIDWGDGRTSTGTVTQSGTTYTVTGSHRYASAGSHTVKTTVTEIGLAAELLLAKVGDEVPDLPEQYRGSVGHGRPTLNGQTNEFARLVAAYLAPDGVGPSAPRTGGGDSGSGRVTLADLRSALTALFDRGDQDGRKPPLATLTASLHATGRANPRVLAALLLLEDLSAERGL